MKPLLILGGTFDPIHCGHLRMALETREACPWAELALLPCGVPGHRTEPLAQPWQRLAMIRRALEPVADISVLLHELQDPLPRFTVDTARMLRRQWPDRPIAWVVGSDAAENLHTWKEADVLPSLIHVLVVTRPGYAVAPPAGFAPAEAFDCQHRRNGLAATLEIPLLDISSSMIRKKRAAGLSITGLVPEGVERYIGQHGLYRPLPNHDHTEGNA
jgi:nicotinate-nucleotide adenylyltransferase